MSSRPSSATAWKFGGSAPHSATFVRRSDEEVLAVAVEARQRADHVPDVGANAEFRHATDVDGYFHRLNLTTGGTGEHREFAVNH